MSETNTAQKQSHKHKPSCEVSLKSKAKWKRERLRERERERERGSWCCVEEWRGKRESACDRGKVFPQRAGRAGLKTWKVGKWGSAGKREKVTGIFLFAFWKQHRAVPLGKLEPTTYDFHFAL